MRVEAAIFSCKVFFLQLREEKYFMFLGMPTQVEGRKEESIKHLNYVPIQLLNENTVVKLAESHTNSEKASICFKAIF